MSDRTMVVGEKPAMDASSLPPVPLDQVLVLINRFIKSTGTFLNDFAAECDARLGQVSKRVDKLQMEVTLLESKLPLQQQQHIDTEQQDEADSMQTKHEVNRSMIQQGEEPRQTSKQGSVPVAVNPVVAAPTSQPTGAPPSASEPTASDPRLNKYLGMIRVGIPKDAVVIKMQLDGLGDLVDKL